MTEVVLCYDSQPRPFKDGALALAPEEQWSLRHGATCAAAGLQVRIARLPLAPGADKAEIDTFIPQAGAAAFQQLIARAPLLDAYHRGLNRALLERHQLPVPDAYPTRRPRPQRRAETTSAASYGGASAPDAPALAHARSAIVEQVAAHATSGEGLLVLAHPPGSGKGHNATLGLKQWLASVPSGDDGVNYSLELALGHFW